MTASTQPADTVLGRAVTVASAAAVQAGVTVRVLESLAEVRAASDLLAVVWRTTPDAPPVNPDLMRALAHVGNYVAGAYSGDTLVGASVGFLTADAPNHLHSHVSGVSPAVQGRSVGFALKLHQRAWALGRGIPEVSWTVDPLVRRNIFFNLVKLRATVGEYLPNFYGDMADGLNAGDESDRLMLSWRVEEEWDGRGPQPAGGDTHPLRLDVATDGGPRVLDVGTARRFACRLPRDVVALRAERPDLARAWRYALRETLGTALDGGGQVVGFSRDGGYLVAR